MGAPPPCQPLTMRWRPTAGWLSPTMGLDGLTSTISDAPPADAPPSGFAERPRRLVRPENKLPFLAFLEFSLDGVMNCGSGSAACFGTGAARTIGAGCCLVEGAAASSSLSNRPAYMATSGSLAPWLAALGVRCPVLCEGASAWPESVDRSPSWGCSQPFSGVSCGRACNWLGARSGTGPELVAGCESRGGAF